MSHAQIRPAVHMPRRYIAARMRLATAAAAVAVLLLPATAARAAEPIMPLAEVAAGMKCTGYSVVRGTEVATFDVEVIDVVDARATWSGPRIMVKASGPAVDETGIGPGFSGSPIHCPDAAGTPKVIGAISEGIGEYGGKVVLATPIESMLGHPVDPPRGATTGVAAQRTLARAKPLAAPLTVSGLSPRLGSALQRAAAKRGRVVLAAPAGPLGSFPPQQLRGGSAMAVGYADGDISASAIGTVSYVDGDKVWAFGHPLDGTGARSLLLQDAYVFRVINNPIAIGESIGSYKYAAAGHALGTLTNDGLSAVVGRLGTLPATIPVTITAKDLDTGAEQTVASNVANESAVDQPTGGSILSLIAPLVVTQAAGTVLGGSPARLTGRACFEIALRDVREPVRFCNRYVTDLPDVFGGGNAVASAASTDLLDALLLIDSFKAGTVDVTGISGEVEIRRGQRQAYLRDVRLPRRVRAGTKKVDATLVLQHIRGAVERQRVQLRLPGGMRPGRRTLVFTGTDVDLGLGDLFELIEFDLGGGGGGGGALGPKNLRRLIDRLQALQRYDGVAVRRGGDDPEFVGRGRPSYRDPDLRISGRVKTSIRITKRRATR